MSKLLLLFMFLSSATGCVPFTLPPQDNSENKVNYPFLQGEKYGYMERDGTITIDAAFEEAYFYSEGKAVVKTEQGYGYIDEQGAFVIQPQFDDAYSFCEGFAVVAVKNENGMNQYGYINAKGNWLVKPIYDNAYSFSQGIGIVTKDVDSKITDTGFRCILINAQGRIAFELPDYIISPFSEGVAAAAAYFGAKWGYIDALGAVVVQPSYDLADTFRDGLGMVAIVQGKWKYGFIDHKGQSVIELIYDDAKEFSEGLAPVKQDGKWGYISKDGVTMIPFQFDDANVFSESVATVRQNDKCGIIDKNGQWIVEPQYEYIDMCRNGLMLICDVDRDSDYTLVSKKIFKYYIDKSGNIITPHANENIRKYL